jgi:hypothetical protein
MNYQMPKLAGWNRHRQTTKLYVSGIDRPSREKMPQPLPETGHSAAVVLSYYTPVLVELNGTLYTTVDKFSNTTAKTVYKAAQMFAPENFKRVSFWEFAALLFKAGYLGSVKRRGAFGADGYDLGWLNSANNGGLTIRQFMGRKRISAAQAQKLLTEQLRVVSSVEAGKRELLRHGANVPNSYIIPAYSPSAGDTRFSMYALEKELLELTLTAQALEKIVEGQTLTEAQNALRLLSALEPEVDF